VAPSIGGPTKAGAILWAQGNGAVYSTFPDGTTTLPQLAVYPDGTVRRTPVLRNLGYVTRPIRGQIIATLSRAALARVVAETTVVPPETAADWSQGYSFTYAAPNADVVLDIQSRRSCFTSLSSCVPAQLQTVSHTTDALFTASEAKWRAARVGTVSLDAEVTIAGPWPLDESIVKDGLVEISDADYAKVSKPGNYRLSNGDYVSLDAAVTTKPGTMDVYLTRRSVYSLDDGDLRTQLLANQGRYSTSNGEWLGIDLGEDRFTAAKNRELAVDPTTKKLYGFAAIEHLDLRSDGPIELP
jgi:hypothetical protein